MKKCNPENMRTLVEALYSGDYKQTDGLLRRGDEKAGYTYCCLGVATDLAAKAGVDIAKGMHADGFDVWASGVLPEPVKEWLGIDELNPLLDFAFGERMRATSANDNYNQDFYLIARAFDRTYLRADVDEVED